MRKRKDIKTTTAEIIHYWQSHSADHMINVDWEDASEYCWRCACKRNLQRCHIIPDSLGGKDEPSNFVLLCEPCHAEGPNVDDPDIMWDWIAAHGGPFYDIFWLMRGQKEYEFIYGRTIGQEISEIFARADVQEITKQQVSQYLYNAVARTSIHFGQIYPNSATIAGTYRMLLKSVAADYGVQFPIAEET